MPPVPTILADATLVEPPATYLQPSRNKTPWKLEGETQLAGAGTLTLLLRPPWLTLGAPITPRTPFLIALLTPLIVPLGTKATPNN